MHKSSTFHHLRIYLKSCNSPSLHKRLPRVHHSRVVCASNNTKDLPTKPAVCAAVRPCLLVACGLAPASSSTLTTSADPDIAPNIRAVYCNAINRLHSTLLLAQYVINKEVNMLHTYKMLMLVAVYICSMFQESFTCLQIAFVSSMHQGSHTSLQRGNHTLN